MKSICSLSWLAAHGRCRAGEAKKKKDDPLRGDIQKALKELLGGKSTKTPEERKELRDNLRLAMQFRAIEAKIGDDEYGSGFTDSSYGKEQIEDDE